MWKIIIFPLSLWSFIKMISVQENEISQNNNLSCLEGLMLLLKATTRVYYQLKKLIV